jgi:hypothetical protein
VLIERQNSGNYGISCSNRTLLQEYNIAIGSVVLCVKGLRLRFELIPLHYALDSPGFKPETEKNTATYS